MDNIFPENQINVQADDNSEIANIENEGVSVGPGEGQMPTNILAEKDWNVKSFSHLFPNGKYGLHHSRELDSELDSRIFNISIKGSSIKIQDMLPHHVLYMLLAHTLRNSSWRVQENLLKKVKQYLILKTVLQYLIRSAIPQSVLVAS